MAKQSTQGLLKEILSDDIEDVYISITEKAVNWVLAGFIDEANDLLEQLWQFKLDHSGHLWQTDEGLQILWLVSRKKPSYVPFAFKFIDPIEKENWSDVFYPKYHESYTSTFLHKPFAELTGKELYVKAIYAAYEGSANIPDIVAALKRFAQTEHAGGYDFFHATTCGALLAADNDLRDEATYFIRSWGQCYLAHWGNYIPAYLLRNRQTAEILLTGILAPILKITKELCVEETTAIIDALRTRLDSGRTLVYNNLSWEELLHQISTRAIEQKTTDFPEHILQSKSLSRPPATMADIAAAESRLGHTLPDDYKDFLLTSNGFEGFSDTGVVLCRIDQVVFLSALSRETVDIWANAMEGVDNGFGDKLRSSIVIGGLREEQQLLLIPLPDGQWECWHFSSWRPGEVVYESFRFYMEEELQRLEDNFYTD
jgi:hypothetical protein